MSATTAFIAKLPSLVITGEVQSAESPSFSRPVILYDLMDDPAPADADIFTLAFE